MIANPLQPTSQDAEALVARDPEAPMTRADFELAKRQMMAEMEARLEQQVGARVESTVRAISARLTETPCNFHQATVYFAASDSPEDAAASAKAPLFFVASVAIVLMQTFAATGMLTGTSFKGCSSSDECTKDNPGTWCNIGRSDRCEFCGGGTGVLPRADSEDGPANNLTLVAEVCAMPHTSYISYFHDSPTNFPATAVGSWCETCIRNDGTVDPLTATSLMRANIAAMGGADICAFIFSACFVALSVIGELKDIIICSIAIAHAGEKLSRAWRLGLAFLCGIR